MGRWPPGDSGLDLGLRVGAGEGNRTLMTSLEGWGSAIELRPRSGCTRRNRAQAAKPVAYRLAAPDWPLCPRNSDPGQPSPEVATGRHMMRAPAACGRFTVPREGRLRLAQPGCSAAWLARLLWEQEVAGSNPAIPTIFQI
jgi:hypothetical protein